MRVENAKLKKMNDKIEIKQEPSHKSWGGVKVNENLRVGGFKFVL